MPAPIKPFTAPGIRFVPSELPNPHKKTTDALSVDPFQPIFNKTYTDNLYAYNLFARHWPSRSTATSDPNEPTISQPLP